MYYITELQNANSIGRWYPTKAKTLAGAKRAASRDKMFQGTVVAVAVAIEDEDGNKSYDKVAVKRPYEGWTDLVEV